MITIEDNLADLNVALGEYLKHTSKSVDESMAKQGSKIAFEISKEMAAMKPGKGAIRAERLAALKAGEGVKVRKSIRNWKPTRRKRADSSLNIQALRVRKELNLRERGRGFMAFASRVNMGKVRRNAKVLKKGKPMGQQLAEAGLRFEKDGASLRLVYGGSRSEFGGTLNRPKFQRHINAALVAVTADILTYVDRKQREAK